MIIPTATGTVTANENRKKDKIDPGIKLRLFTAHTIAAAISPQYRRPINNKKNIVKKIFIIFFTKMNVKSQVQ